MATTTRYPIRIPLRLPRPIEPTESPASKPHRSQTPNLPPTLHTSAPCFRSDQRQPTRSNLHSLNSWPAVQCNEGFCNAPQNQCFTLTMTTASQKPHHSAKCWLMAHRVNSRQRSTSVAVPHPGNSSGSVIHFLPCDHRSRDVAHQAEV